MILQVSINFSDCAVSPSGSQSFFCLLVAVPTRGHPCGHHELSGSCQRSSATLPHSNSISPQFHCIFDDHFQTLSDNAIPSSQWQEKAYFREPELTRDEVEVGSEPKEKPHEGVRERVQGIRKNIPEEPQNDFTPGEEPLDRGETTQIHEQTPLEVVEAPREEMHQQQEQPERRTRSQRMIRPPTWYADYIGHKNTAFKTLYMRNEGNVAEDDPIVAMNATSDPDTLYLWEAKKEPDFDKFQEAMQQEKDGHTKRKNWKLRIRSTVACHQIQLSCQQYGP
jgi:hypothetical protein